MNVRKIVMVLVIAVIAAGVGFSAEREMGPSEEIVAFLEENGVDTQTFEGLDDLLADDELRLELTFLINRALYWDIRRPGDTATMYLGRYSWTLHNPVPEE